MIEPVFVFLHYCK